jgi:hypothetical protein
MSGPYSTADDVLLRSAIDRLVTTPVVGSIEVRDHASVLSTWYKDRESAYIDILRELNLALSDSVTIVDLPAKPPTRMFDIALVIDMILISTMKILHIPRMICVLSKLYRIYFYSSHVVNKLPSSAESVNMISSGVETINKTSIDDVVVKSIGLQRSCIGNTIAGLPICADVEDNSPATIDRSVIHGLSLEHEYTFAPTLSVDAANTFLCAKAGMDPDIRCKSIKCVCSELLYTSLVPDEPRYFLPRMSAIDPSIVGETLCLLCVRKKFHMRYLLRDMLSPHKLSVTPTICSTVRYISTSGPGSYDPSFLNIVCANTGIVKHNCGYSHVRHIKDGIACLQFDQSHMFFGGPKNGSATRH